MAFDLENLKQIIAVAKDSGLSEIEIKEGDCTYRCVLNASTQVVQPQMTTEPLQVAEPVVLQKQEQLAAHAIRSPMVGTVYLAPSPDASPFVSEGKPIKKGDVVCLIEAMKMFNKVKADRDGTIKSLRIKDGTNVEFHQVLFELEEA